MSELIIPVSLDRIAKPLTEEHVSWRTIRLRTRNFDFNQINLYWRTWGT